MVQTTHAATRHNDRYAKTVSHVLSMLPRSACSVLFAFSYLVLQVSATGSRNTDIGDRCVGDGRSDVISTPDRTKARHLISHFDYGKCPTTAAVMTSFNDTWRAASRSEPSALASCAVSCQTGCCAAMTQRRNGSGHLLNIGGGFPETVIVAEKLQQQPLPPNVDCLILPQMTGGRRCAHHNARVTVARTSSYPSTYVDRITVPYSDRDVTVCAQLCDHMSCNRHTTVSRRCNPDTAQFQCQRCLPSAGRMTQISGIAGSHSKRIASDDCTFRR